MLNTNVNWRIKIISSVFAAVNLAMIASTLASCAVQKPEPLPLPIEQEKPAFKPTLQPNQPKQQDNDDQDDDSKDDKDDDDKD